MRTLDAELLAEQKKLKVTPAYEVAFSYPSTAGTPNYTFDHSQILDLMQEEGSYSNNVSLYINDNAGTVPSLLGYKANMRLGLSINGTAKYEDFPFYRVQSQVSDSYNGKVVTKLNLLGEVDYMGQQISQYTCNHDISTVDYQNETVKDIMGQLFSLTGAHTVEDHIDWGFYIDGTHEYPKYSMQVDADVSTAGVFYTYKLMEAFGVAQNDNRLDKIKQLVDVSEIRIRWISSGTVPSMQPYIIDPVTSGTVYDYEYKVAVDEHQFPSVSFRSKLVIPNSVVVIGEGGVGETVGAATNASSYNLYPVQQLIYQEELTTDEDCTNLAKAIISQKALDAQSGVFNIPIMNIGQELYDYIKLTDPRTSKTYTGNVQFIRRHAGGGRYDMQIYFGKPDFQQAQPTGNLEEVVASLMNTVNSMLAYIEQIKSGRTLVPIDASEENKYLWANPKTGLPEWNDISSISEFDEHFSVDDEGVQLTSDSDPELLYPISFIYDTTEMGEIFPTDTRLQINAYYDMYIGVVDDYQVTAGGDITLYTSEDLIVYADIVDLSDGGVLIVPLVSANPASLSDGMLWYNTTDEEFRVRIDGVTKNIMVGELDFITELDERVDDLETDVSDLQGDVSYLLSAVSALQGDVKSLADDIDAIEGDISSIEGTLSDHESRIQALEK